MKAEITVKVKSGHNEKKIFLEFEQTVAKEDSIHSLLAYLMNGYEIEEIKLTQITDIRQLKVWPE
jgi:pyruvate dehydrogenase complex dehydrogenase (E1) component